MAVFTPTEGNHKGLSAPKVATANSSTSNETAMSDPLIRACDDYVVLEPGQPERLLSSNDTLVWLTSWLEQLDELPEDLRDQPSVHEAAQRLLDTACDLELSSGLSLQWFAVRLDALGS